MITMPKPVKRWTRGVTMAEIEEHLGRIKHHRKLEEDAICESCGRQGKMRRFDFDGVPYYTCPTDVSSICYPRVLRRLSQQATEESEPQLRDTRNIPSLFGEDAYERGRKAVEKYYEKHGFKKLNRETKFLPVNDYDRGIRDRGRELVKEYRAKKYKEWGWSVQP